MLERMCDLFVSRCPAEPLCGSLGSKDLRREWGLRAKERILNAVQILIVGAVSHYLFNTVSECGKPDSRTPLKSRTIEL